MSFFNGSQNREWFGEHCTGYMCSMDADAQLDEEVNRAVYWIRKAAYERGLSLEQIAAFSGVSRSSVVQMGKDRRPTLRTLASVASYLECEVKDLLMPIPDGGEG